MALPLPAISPVYGFSGRGLGCPYAPDIKVEPKRYKQSRSLSMGYTYPKEVVQEFIEDYWDEWDALIPFEDAVLMLSLSDALSALLAKYEGEADDDSPLARMTSSIHRR
jgi:hypothetical protein